jgi:hypothetical protein
LAIHIFGGTMGLVITRCRFGIPQKLTSACARWKLSPAPGQ